MADEKTTNETLWCVHIPGPDDLYAAVNRGEAQRHADALNRAIRRYFEQNPRTENDASEESMTALVIPWPWDTESHTRDAIRWVKAECRGNA